MSPQQALTIAREKGLDLVEISPTAQPPVCRVMDFGRYQYEEQKRTRQAKKHQKTIEVKEIKFRPKVDEHDYQFMKKHVERFLAHGDKVKATIFFEDVKWLTPNTAAIFLNDWLTIWEKTRLRKRCHGWRGTKCTPSYRVKQPLKRVDNGSINDA